MANASVLKSLFLKTKEETKSVLICIKISTKQGRGDE
jgi:hypothetical protein